LDGYCVLVTRRPAGLDPAQLTIGKLISVNRFRSRLTFWFLSYRVRIQADNTQYRNCAPRGRRSRMARQKKLPKVLSADERERFLATFNTRYDSPMRNLCLCRVMLETGLRAGEVVALKPEHLDMTTLRLTVREGKGSRDRTLWVPFSLRDLIGEWLLRRPASPWLFSTRDGKQISTRYLRTMVKHAAEKAAVAEWQKVSPHSLRHTFATKLYEDTQDILIVQAALGHADLSSTMIYTHLVNGELEAAMTGTPRDEVQEEADEAKAVAVAILATLPAEVQAALANLMDEEGGA